MMSLAPRVTSSRWFTPRVMLRGLDTPAMQPIASYLRRCWAQMQRLDGPVAAARVQFPSPADASQHLHALALDAGADIAGFTGVRPHYLAAGFEEPLPFAIVLGMPMSFDEIRQAPSEAAGIEAFRVYHDLAEVAIRVADAIRALGWRAYAHHPLNEMDPSRRLFFIPMAIDAGLAEIARSGVSVTPQFGPLLRWTAVTTDLPLATGSPRRLGVAEFCELCTACLRACPTGAIARERTRVNGVLKWVTDGERCRQPVAESACCGVCLAVCPYSRPDARATLLAKHWAIIAQDPP